MPFGDQPTTPQLQRNDKGRVGPRFKPEVNGASKRQLTDAPKSSQARQLSDSKPFSDANEAIDANEANELGAVEPASYQVPAPSTVETPAQQPAPPTTMRIRGQSPNPPQGTPGNSDLFRAPMPVSGGTWPIPPNPVPNQNPNWNPNLNPGFNSGAVPNGYQPVPNPAAYGAPNFNPNVNPYGNMPANPYAGAPMASGMPAPTVRYQNAPLMQSDPPSFNPYASPSDIPAIQAPPNFGMPMQAPPLEQPWTFQGPRSPTTGYQPNVRDVPIDVYLQEAQTGKFVFGGSVNTDLGVAGQIIVEERNFDIRKFPRSWSDLANGAFRGNGENFRLEAMPGNQVQRYSINWTQPNLFGYSPWSLSLGGFYFNRIYRDWSEQRLGGRGMLGYQITPDLSFSTELRAESVKVYSPRVAGVQQLDSVLGNNELYTSRFRLAHSTRDSVFIPTEGHYLELIYDQVFGTYDFPRGQINYSKYFLIRERADGGGRHTLTNAWKVGVSGAQTPIFENYFAGGFTTMRGFSFRGASPVEGGVQVGGRFMFLGTLEYMMPITADDMLRMVAFVDYGTIEQDIKWDWDNFRVAPGLGLRISVPALGPGPLAFDFAVPISSAATDDKQVFSFSVGLSK